MQTAEVRDNPVLKERINERLAMIHADTSRLYDDADMRQVDLHYSDVMRRFFENAGYISRTEYVDIPASRALVAQNAREWFECRGIKAVYRPGNRLELGSFRK